MRIAMIGSRGIPARLGGVERVVETLTTHLAARGHEVLVYARPHYLPDRPAPQAGEVIFTAGWSGKHADAFTHTATACWDVLHRDVDVVHIHSPGPALWSWLPALAGKPIVLTIHAPDWQRDKWSLPARAALRAGLAIGQRCARQITAVSAPLAEELAARLRQPVTCIPNTIDPPPAPAEGLLHRLDLSPDGYVLHVGRIEPEKRLDVLLAAWQQAKLDIPLVIAGDWQETTYGRTCHATAPAGVRFLGPVLGEELSALLAGAAIVAQPSVLEGASLVLLEAAWQGRCVLCTDMPANRAVLGEAAAYVRPDAPNEFAAALVRYMQDAAARQNLGSAACQRVRDCFNPADQAAAMEEVYRQALQR